LASLTCCVATLEVFAVCIKLHQQSFRIVHIQHRSALHTVFFVYCNVTYRYLTFIKCSCFYGVLPISILSCAYCTSALVANKRIYTELKQLNRICFLTFCTHGVN